MRIKTAPRKKLNRQEAFRERGDQHAILSKKDQEEFKKNSNNFLSPEIDQLNKLIDDSSIHPYLLMKYNAHINVEVCSTSKAVKYVYKYVYKGRDRANVRLQRRQDRLVLQRILLMNYSNGKIPDIFKVLNVAGDCLLTALISNTLRCAAWPSIFLIPKHSIPRYGRHGASTTKRS
ncbi:hypothetical protein VTP01DRAFT_3431 [Rhizomucor pusillus]|uniref:uncharacterized protein n=1 Tax=Rhizomucor pusillus TaxID=4840 RepID=UPI0037434D15